MQDLRILRLLLETTKARKHITKTKNMRFPFATCQKNTTT